MRDTTEREGGGGGGGDRESERLEDNKELRRIDSHKNETVCKIERDIYKVNTISFFTSKILVIRFTFFFGGIPFRRN